jgi:hypothetical protein
MPYPDDNNHTACGEIESCHQRRQRRDANGWNFVPKRDLKGRIREHAITCATGDNSLPAAVLAELAPLDRSWCCLRLRLRLKGG